MKKKSVKIRGWSDLAVVLTLFLFAGILSGCGSKGEETTAAETTAAAETTTAAETTAAVGAEGKEKTKKAAGQEKTVSILGAWDNDVDQMSLYFDDDGIVIVSDFYDEIAAEYEWDGETLSIEDPSGGDMVSGILEDVDGEECIDLGDEYEGYFYRVDDVFYRPDWDELTDEWEEEGEDDEESEEEVPAIVGAWDDVESQNSLTFLEDGTGQSSDPWVSFDFTYEWDGEKADIYLGGSYFSGEAWLEDDNTLVIDDSVMIRVDAATWVPGALSGGMESELEGDWVHENGYIMLTFDGVDTASYQRTDDAKPWGAGTYIYDGETLTVSFIGDSGEVEDHKGYLNDDGNIVIDIWGEEGVYTRGDSSQLIHPQLEVEVTGPEADLVGEWTNRETDDGVTFDSSGSAGYYISGHVGYDSSFKYDGENVSFGSFTGHLDENGDLVVDGVDGIFERDTD